MLDVDGWKYLFYVNDTLAVTARERKTRDPGYKYNCCSHTSARRVVAQIIDVVQALSIVVTRPLWSRQT